MPEVLPAADRAAGRQRGRRLGGRPAAHRAGHRHGARRDRGPAGAGNRVRRPWPHPPVRSRRASPSSIPGASPSSWCTASSGPSGGPPMRLTDFGMDTITLAGPLEAKLRAIRAAGFTQVMLSARDVVGHPDGEPAAVAAVRASGLRVTGFQVLRDFEGLSGHLHDYKIDVAKSMLQLAPGARCARPAGVLVDIDACDRRDRAVVADLRKLAMPAVPLRSAGRLRGALLGTARPPAGACLVHRGTRPSRHLGLCVDSFHTLANEGAVDTLHLIAIPPRSSWSSCPTSSGSRSAAARSASRPRATCACSRVKACTTTSSPNWCAGSSDAVTRGTTVSRSSTTTTGRCRWPRCASGPCGR